MERKDREMKTKIKVFTGLILVILIAAVAISVFYYKTYFAFDPIERRVRSCDEIWIEFSWHFVEQSEDSSFLLSEAPKEITESFEIVEYHKSGINCLSLPWIVRLRKGGGDMGHIGFYPALNWIYFSEELEELNNGENIACAEVNGDFLTALVKVGMPPINTTGNKFQEMYRSNPGKCLKSGARIPVMSVEKRSPFKSQMKYFEKGDKINDWSEYWIRK